MLFDWNNVSDKLKCELKTGKQYVYLIHGMPANVNIKIWSIFLLQTHASCLCFGLGTPASLGFCQAV